MIDWIPTAERLPDDGECVLIAMDDGEVWTGYHEEDQWFYVSADVVSPAVTHWLAFPDAPNAEIRGGEAVPLD